MAIGSLNLLPMSALALSAMTLLGACNSSADSGAKGTADAEVPAPAATVAAAAPRMEWAGKWTGVEGMYVEITPVGETYKLEMQSDLDTLGTYSGTVTADGIAFERDGDTLLLKPASGDETGLKYLAGKTNCLMVEPGEGYCRD